MAALTAGRNTVEALGSIFTLPAAAAKIYAGALVALNNAGYATKGAAATTLIAFGRAEETVDNAAGAAGDLNVKVRTGVFKWANSSAGDLIANTEIGKDCYIVDDQTVAKTNGGATRSRAGKVVFVESDGVWVQMGPQF